MCLDVVRAIETSPRILIIGGYGAVGQWLARQLAVEYPGRVRVGGRDETRAAELCRRIGHGAKPLRLDVTHTRSFAAAVKGVSTVVNCVHLSNARPLRGAVERGVSWIDITPGRRFLHDALELNEKAIQSGSTVLVCAGLVPGLSNLMAAAGTRELNGADRVQTHVCIGAGDEFGPSALDFLLADFPSSRDRSESLGDAVRVSFPPPIGRRTAYTWNLPDAQYFPRTLGVKSASTWLTLDPQWTVDLLERIKRTPGLFGTGSPWLRTFLNYAFPAAKALGLFHGQRHFAVLTDVHGAGRRLRFALTGEDQARATAIVTAAMTTAVREGSRRTGVFLPEQFCDPEDIFTLIRRAGLEVKRSDRRGHGAWVPLPAPASTPQSNEQTHLGC